jgi:hypothetical protein
MTEPTMSRSTDANSVWKVVSVLAPQVVAWRVFTEQMGAWWPRHTTKSERPMQWTRGRLLEAFARAAAA